MCGMEVVLVHCKFMPQLGRCDVSVQRAVQMSGPCSRVIGVLIGLSTNSCAGDV
jgi:hypothetical protein